jgi:hypothetical protein
MNIALRLPAGGRHFERDRLERAKIYLQFEFGTPSSITQSKFANSASAESTQPAGWQTDGS